MFCHLLGKPEKMTSWVDAVVREVSQRNNVKVEILSPNHHNGIERVLYVDAVDFLVKLFLEFEHKRVHILGERQKKNKLLRGGKMPDFLPHTKHIREGKWRIKPVPHDLVNRKAEICAAVENRKLVYDAVFNSGATGFMADFDDAHCPTWHNVISAQKNLYDAIHGVLAQEFGAQKSSKTVVLCRPRSWNLPESHFKVNGQVIGGGIFDFGLYMFHNAKTLIDKGSGPYFYLTKLECHEEARLWNDIFVFSQNYFGIPQGTIKACALIENIMAVFEMDEILYELRDHSCGLNSGMWDYVFSYISKFHHDKRFILPDRSFVNMASCEFLGKYGDLLVKTCHKRGVHATGGMAPMFVTQEQESMKDNKQLVEEMKIKVRDAKTGDAKRGNDGALVAHRLFVPTLRQVFDQAIPSKDNQLDNMRDDVGEVSAAMLLAPPKNGQITENGLKSNINIALRYIHAWLYESNGFLPLNGIVEDAATAEITRSLVWQWVHHRVLMKTERGEELVDLPAVKRIIEGIVKGEARANEFKHAAEILISLTEAKEFPEFMTLVLYDNILKREFQQVKSKL